VDEARETRVVEALPHGIERRIEARRGDRAIPRKRHQIVRPRGQVSDPAVGDVKLRAIAIAKRGPAHHANLTRIIDLSDAAQLLAQNLHLARKLKLVRSVLVMAAAATHEMGARGNDALASGLDHVHQIRSHAFTHLDPRRLAGQQEGRKHHSPVHARQRIAAVDPLFDSYFVYDGSSPFQSRMKSRVFSGIQPTGSPHIGNYLGALKNWAKIQYDYDSIYCIVDLHAVTLYQDPAELRAKIEELVGMLLAIGIDPAHSSLVVQSSIPAHAELAWMLTCVTPVGWLERMTQYKTKAQVLETVGDGLLQYPVLMAADILLYQAAIVPVGDDQSQHLELARDIAQRFNSLYGETFVMPATHLPTVGARVMGLDNPETKMSKSAAGSGHAVSLLDPPDAIRKKIMRATTDSNPVVDSANMSPGVRNLLTIFQAFTEWRDPEVEAHFGGMRYGDLKKQVADAVVAALEPIQKRYREIIGERGYVARVLEEGAGRITPIANDTVLKVKKAMGLYTV